jgi:hypothetical protein
LASFRNTYGFATPSGLFCLLQPLALAQAHAAAVLVNEFDARFLSVARI